MVHHPIPKRILESDRIPVTLLPRGAAFIDQGNRLWMRVEGDQVLSDLIYAVAIDGGALTTFRDIDLVRPASGAFVGFVAGTRDMV